jgi:hypothetical protein
MTTTFENDNNIVNRDYFMLAIRNWDNKLEEYFPVGEPSTLTQSFGDYSSAESAYFATNYQSFPKEGGEDVKIELLHVRFGIPHMIRNRILFP